MKNRTEAQRSKDRERQRRYRARKDSLDHAQGGEEGTEIIPFQEKELRSSNAPFEIQEMFALTLEGMELEEYSQTFYCLDYAHAMSQRSRCYTYLNQLRKEYPHHSESMRKAIDAYKTFELSVQGKRLIFTQKDNNPLNVKLREQLNEMRLKMDEKRIAKAMAQATASATAINPPSSGGDLLQTPQAMATSLKIADDFEQISAQAPAMATAMAGEEIGDRHPRIPAHVWTGKGWKHEDSMQGKIAIKTKEKKKEKKNVN